MFLLVNPVEYHGPHLPLCTDEIISRGLCRDIWSRIGPGRGELLLGGELELGVEPVPGPGSREVSFEVLRKVVAEAVDGLIGLGARGIVLMTFHGSPLHSVALSEGVARAMRRGVRAIAPLNLLMTKLRDFTTPELEIFRPAVRHLAQADELLAELPLDYHAGFFETSLVLHYSPASVEPLHERLRPCPPIRPVESLERLARLSRGPTSRELHFAAAGLGWFQLDPFPGYTGRPHLASARSGAAFAEILADSFAERIDQVLRGSAEPPEPIMSWLSWVSLRGRIRGNPIVVPASVEQLLVPV